MSVRVSNKQYKNFGNCVFLDNGLISLGVTVDLGPRIIYFARRGKENVLFEDVERRFTEPAGEYGSWVAYGGHRIWIAPEVNPETYYPDNAPVSCSIEGNRLILTPPATPFGKEFTVIIEIDDTAPVVKLTHRIKKCFRVRDRVCSLVGNKSFRRRSLHDTRKYRQERISPQQSYQSVGLLGYL